MYAVSFLTPASILRTLEYQNLLLIWSTWLFRMVLSSVASLLDLSLPFFQFKGYSNPSGLLTIAKKVVRAEFALLRDQSVIVELDYLVLPL